jgi:hypothetical protein
MKTHFQILSVVTTVGLLLILGTRSASAHCDSLDGPVVSDARLALEQDVVDPVLKWISPDALEEIREVFADVQRVRALGEDAATLADRHFFETVVRLHRQSEGAPYTGLKPSGEIPAPIREADRALETGTIDDLAAEVAGQLERGIRERFETAYASRAHADHNAEAGRRYVRDYVRFVHYVEALHDMGGGHDQEGTHETPAEGHHGH